MRPFYHSVQTQEAQGETVTAAIACAFRSQRRVVIDLWQFS